MDNNKEHDDELLDEFLSEETEAEFEPETELEPDLNDITDREDDGLDTEGDVSLDDFLSEEEAEEASEEPDSPQKQGGRRLTKQAATIISICALVLVFIGSGIMAFYLYDRSSKNHIMKFDGKKIDVGMYELFLFLEGDPGTALNNLTDYLLVEKMAAARNITLDEDEQYSIDSSIEGFMDYLVNQGMPYKHVTLKILSRVLTVDRLYSRLAYFVGEECVIDEHVFQEAFEDYKLNYADYFVDKGLKFIISESRDEIGEAKALIESGTPVDDVIKSYCIEYRETFEIQTITLSDLPFESDVMDGIAALEDFEVSEIVDLDDFSPLYAIFISVGDISPTDEELEESFRDYYVQNLQYDYFMAEFESCRDSSKIDYNEKAKDAVPLPY